MIYINLHKGGHRDDWNDFMSTINPNIKIIYKRKNFKNFIKLILDKDIVFSCLSDGMRYIFFISFFRRLFFKKTKFIYFEKFHATFLKKNIYYIYLFFLNLFGTVLYVSSSPSKKSNCLVDLNFIDLDNPKKNELKTFDIGYFGAISKDKNFDGFIDHINNNAEKYKNVLISSYNITEIDYKKISKQINLTIIDRQISKDEFIYNLSSTEFVWACYDYNQTSGIFGSCYQLNLKVIVLEGGYLDSLNYKNSYILVNNTLANSFSLKSKKFSVQRDREFKKWQALLCFI